MPNEIRVANWSELHCQLFEDTWNPTIGRFRSNYLYRGIGDSSEDLRTGLMRLGGNIRHVDVDIIQLDLPQNIKGRVVSPKIFEVSLTIIRPYRTACI